MEKSTPVPTTDDEVIDLLTEGRGVPIDGEKSYVNWDNDFQNLADDLKRRWIDEGPSAFVDRVRSVSRQICEEAFERQGDDPSLIEQRHIDATAVRTMFSPDTNVGTRSNYVGGVFAEVQWYNRCVDDGFNVVDRRSLAPPVPVDDLPRVAAILEALGCDEPIKMTKQERNGWDFVTITPTGHVETHQVKSTSTKPSWKSNKDYDVLVWVDGGDIHVRDGKDADWHKL